MLSFLAAWLSVRQQNGTLILRIEDIDQQRCHAHFEHEIREDLIWFGLHWDKESPAQSTRQYDRPLERLTADTFFCTCTRRSLRRRCAQGYDDHCRALNHPAGALRFTPEEPLRPIDDRAFGRCFPPLFPDAPVLRRADGQVSYTLSVVADDITDGVTEVIRGSDLLSASPLQAHLWRRLGNRPPSWCHVPTVYVQPGKKLSKSNKALSIRQLRERGWSAQQLRALCFEWLGLSAHLSTDEAVQLFSPKCFPLRGILLTNYYQTTQRSQHNIDWKVVPESL